ncbi:MAG: chorismate lyase [Pseudomonadota bacterium]
MLIKPLPHFSAVAKWYDHVNAVHASQVMANWLTHRASLTARLVARCQQFRVQRLHQGLSICLEDEFAAIGLPRSAKVVQREVVLRCDERAVVYAHTVVPTSANATQWPLFAALGNKSLGTTLFSDPLVERGALSYARLRHTHPLMKRIAALQLVQEPENCLYARRSVFKRKGGCLLVTEVFLPGIRQL